MKVVARIFSIICMMLAYSSIGQTAEVITNPVKVSFKKVNHPLMVRITKPEGFNSNEKSRGFKKVTVKNLLFEGFITDKNGIAEARVNENPLTLASDGFFSIQLALTPGDNELIVSATDKDGNDASESFFFSVEMPEQLRIGSYHALIIGVDQYEDNRITDLDRPIQDANLLKEVLVSNYTFEEQNIKLLENASRRDIIDALDNYRDSLSENDNLLIFYAGHGYWDDENEIGYWIPSDARQSSTADWFRNTTLTDQIRAIRTKHTLLIADACFSGTIFKSRSTLIDADKAIKVKYELPSRKAMTSGTLTQVPDRSAFIRYLVKRLEDNQEKYLAANNLFYSMETAVINNSDDGVKPQYGTIQKVGDEGGDFIFVRKE